MLVFIASWPPGWSRWARREQRALATVAALGIPAQAVLGGLDLVLTHLNPWLVALHFMLSMAIIAVTFALWWRATSPAPGRRHGVRAHPGDAAAGAPDRAGHGRGADTLIGTIVTGSGPHAGDKAADGTVRRTGAAGVVHGPAARRLGHGADRPERGPVVAARRALHAAAAQQRAAAVLLGVEVAQGAIGYTQYLQVPPLLVGLHMLGACLVWLAVLRVATETAGHSPLDRSAAG